MSSESSKHMFITGATAGIGAALVGLAIKQGFRITALGRRAERIEQLAEQYGDAVCAVIADVTDRASLDAAVRRGVERFGPLTAVIANAGRGVDGALLDVSADDLRAVFETNLIGVHQTVLATRGHWSSHARVVIVASIVSGLTLPRMGAYCATKHAIDAYASSLRMELHGEGFHIASVHPGSVATEFFDVALQPGKSWTWRPGKPASAEQVARVCLQAAIGPKRRRWWVPFTTRWAVRAYRAFPGFTEWLFRKKLANME